MNELLSTWVPHAKLVDDLTALEIVPRNLPSVLSHIVADIQSFAEMNNMELNSDKCKDSLIVDFLQFNSSVPQPIVIGAIQNGNRTNRSAITAKIIRVITKSTDRAAGV